MEDIDEGWKAKGEAKSIERKYPKGKGTLSLLTLRTTERERETIVSCLPPDPFLELTGAPISRIMATGGPPKTL